MNSKSRTDPCRATATYTFLRTLVSVGEGHVVTAAADIRQSTTHNRLHSRFRQAWLAFTKNDRGPLVR